MTFPKPWMILSVPALFALGACTAAPDEDPPSKDVEAKPVVGEVAAQMKPSCMVNDEGTEAICCSPDDCFYVDLRPYDPYKDR